MEAGKIELTESELKKVSGGIGVSLIAAMEGKSGFDGKSGLPVSDILVKKG